MKDAAKRFAIAKAIRECRLEAHMSQKEFARALGCKLFMVIGWERGSRNFYFHEFIAICEVLKLDPVELAQRFQDVVNEASDGHNEPLGFI